MESFTVRVIGSVIAVIVAWAGFFVYTLVEAAPPVYELRYRLEYEARVADACLVARQFVVEQVKSPSTAVFSPCHHPDSAVLGRLDHPKWVVKGWVDAQNGFGAVVRSTYVLTMRYEADQDVWVLDNLGFMERE